MKHTINNVTPIYTGGGFYIYLGEIDNNYFIADDNCNDVRIVNSDPAINENYTDTTWQEAHLVRDMETGSPEHLSTFQAILQWIINNKPSGAACNYNITDIEARLNA